MAFKNRLLATAAIPLIALMAMGPVSAAELIRPVAPEGAQSLIIKVQATDDELLQQQKKERKERRQNRQNQNDDAGQDDQNNGNNKRRNKQNNTDAQQQDNVQQQDNSQEVQQPRRKKQNSDADMQMQQNDQTQQDDQEQIKPRKKKHDNAEQQMQQDNADQTQQGDQEQVKPRRKKQNDNAASDQNQTDDDALKNALDKNNKKHRKQNDAATQDDSGQQMQQDNADQTQQDDQEQVKPRRKKQNDNAASDQNQTDDDALKNALEKNNKKHRKHNDAATQDDSAEPTDNSNGSIEKIETRKKKQQDAADDAEAGDKTRADRKPVDVKKAKDIAADPSKTTDTVVLPVENGAAVLDSDKDADNRGADRNRRKKEREDVKPVRLPKSDKDAQAGFKEDKERIRVRPVLEDKGERIPGFKGYDDFGGRRVGDRDNRFVINIGGHIVIRSDDDTRVARNNQIRYERLPNGLIREIVVRPDGDRIVTVRNRYGEIVRRSRIDRGDREVVIFYSPDLESGRDRLFLRDPGDDLPPMRLRIPVEEYIIDVSSGRNRNYEEFLDQPPVEPVERVYSVDEVKNSARVRDKMRRIDLDTITFDTGSAEISMDQASSLKQVGAAIKQILDNDPGETFLIEGHTDAVGSDESNLVLSDSRAESVANVLSDAFEIPAENLVTQGYGERFLKIDEDGPVRENRRVTIRRITPLVRPLASQE